MCGFEWSLVAHIPPPLHLGSPINDQLKAANENFFDILDVFGIFLIFLALWTADHVISDD